mgnify:FL=1
MQTYEVEISGELLGTVLVEAESEEAAEQYINSLPHTTDIATLLQMDLNADVSNIGVESVNEE